MNDQLTTLLKAKGYRVTKPRLTILKLFHTTNTPLDAENILTHLKVKNVSTDLTTVYRFLNTFINDGMLRKIEIGEGKYRFELTSLPHHHHLICNSCGDIQDIKVNDSVILEKIKPSSDFKIDHHHLEFFGTCGSCQST